MLTTDNKTKRMSSKYTIGLDYGSDSVRSLIVNVDYRRRNRQVRFLITRVGEKGMYCDPQNNQFRQHPKDYLEGLEYTVTQALKQAPEGVAQNVVGISVDTTGSTPVAVDEKGGSSFIDCRV